MNKEIVQFVEDVFEQGDSRYSDPQSAEIVAFFIEEKVSFTTLNLYPTQNSAEKNWNQSQALNLTTSLSQQVNLKIEDFKRYFSKDHFREEELMPLQLMNLKRLSSWNAVHVAHTK